MELENQLKRAGLSKSEIKIYLYILENGVSSPPQIAKTTGIARTNSYHILQTLKEKELIEVQTKGKRLVFIATDPSAIVRNIEDRRVAMEIILPDLRALYTTQKNKPKIKFYEGFEQVREIYNQTLEAEETFGIASTSVLDSHGEDFISDYAKKMKARGRILHDLVASDAGKKLADIVKQNMGGLYTSYSSNKKFEEIPTDILIWNDNIALISFAEPVFGTVLTNKPLAQTFRVLFQLATANTKKE